MSTTIRTDSAHARELVHEPCLCSQMAPGWFHASPEVLREHADPACSSCAGTGVEEVLRDRPEAYLNWSTDNARLVFAALGLPFERCEATVAEVRRGLLRAANVDLAPYSREPRAEYATRVVDLAGEVPAIERRLRCADPGLDQDGIARRLEALRTLVDRDAALGATVVRWDF